MFLYKNRMWLKKISLPQCFFSHPSESNFIFFWTWLLSSYILKNSASRTFFSRSAKNEIVGDNQARCAPSCNKSEEAIWDKWLILLLRLGFCCGLRAFNYSEGSSPISGPPSVQAIYKSGQSLCSRVLEASPTNRQNIKWNQNFSLHYLASSFVQNTHGSCGHTQRWNKFFLLKSIFWNLFNCSLIEVSFQMNHMFILETFWLIIFKQKNILRLFLKITRCIQSLQYGYIPKTKLV